MANNPKVIDLTSKWVDLTGKLSLAAGSKTRFQHLSGKDVEFTIQSSAPSDDYLGNIIISNTGSLPIMTLTQKAGVKLFGRAVRGGEGQLGVTDPDEIQFT